MIQTKKHLILYINQCWILKHILSYLILYKSKLDSKKTSCHILFYVNQCWVPKHILSGTSDPLGYINAGFTALPKELEPPTSFTYSKDSTNLHKFTIYIYTLRIVPPQVLLKKTWIQPWHASDIPMQEILH